jgi:hypothetical protein
MEITFSRVAVIAIGEQAIARAMRHEDSNFGYDHEAVAGLRSILSASKAVARGCNVQDGITCPMRQAGYDPEALGSVARFLAFAWDDVSREAIPKMPTRTPHIVRIED